MERSWDISAKGSCYGVAAPTRDSKAGIELQWTLQLIRAIGAELALAAHTGHPFDADTVTLFPQLFYIVGYCDDDASSFVARDTLGALVHLGATGCELIVNEASIGSTDATVVDLAEDLAGSGVWDGDSCDLALSGGTFAFLDGGVLMSWELHGWLSGDDVL